MTETEMIKVMIVDDHAVVRSGLAAFFVPFPDLELVGEADSGDAALDRCEHLNPDVILMDLILPGMDGITAIRLIKEKHPSIQIIALTSFQEEELIQGALQAGAIGYLTKNVTALELASAIRSARAGRMSLSQEATKILVQSKLRPRLQEELTDREVEVLKLLVDGLNNTEIADQLVISLSTVKYHIGNIFGKLGVDNRVEAVTSAITKKLV